MIQEIAKAGKSLRTGDLTSMDLTTYSLERAAVHENLGALAYLDHDGAVQAARKADEELRTGCDRGPLHGIPLTVKDVIDVAGMPTKLGTPAAGHVFPSEDADVVGLLRERGAIILGKTALYELALGMSSPGIMNPRNPNRMAGGSSGGSAAAVAAGIGLGSVGTDTGGSVRCPAALTGVVGIKPTFGSISLRGIHRLAKGQDTVGFLANDSESCAVLAREAMNMTVAPRRPLRCALLGGSLDQVQRAVRGQVMRVLDRVRKGDSDILDEVRVEGGEMAPSISLLVILYEAANEWGTLVDSTPFGFGPWVLGALLAGRTVDTETYRDARARARELRRRIISTYESEKIDLVITPTLPNTAPELDANTIDIDGCDVPIAAAHTRLVSLASVTGLPAISVPCGTDHNGLPIGIQAIGRPGTEEQLFRFAAQVESDGRT